MKYISTLAVVSIVGCTSTADVHHQADGNIPNGIRLMSSTAQIIVNNGDGTVCYGPPADATIDLDASTSFKGLQLGAGDNEIPLGGRNPNVLLTRDILFQACLAESRMDLSKNERKALFNSVLKTISDINTQTLEGESVSTDADSGSQVIPGQMVTKPSSNDSSSSSESSGGF